ncbi:MAG TPA: TonB-dependent receptor [Burkholderiales bacterium]|nr:TonB-dependent receptor [Burkholderiales bacterium]
MRRMKSGEALRLALAGLGILLTSLAFRVTAAESTPASASNVKDLTELSLEQLGEVIVTSVSRREERLADAAAAIYVISNDDIRRAGVTSLPEALRLAPNLQVARADANQYAISARGFNQVLANKMLVQIDGRTVYSPLFSGVFWEVQNVMLEDVDRIEVISGPGATQWGANAVNGVINVITRRAENSQGALVAAGGGNNEKAASVRYGSTTGNGHFRVYGMGFERDNTRLNTGAEVMDASSSGQAGFRADWGTQANSFTLQGDTYRTDIDQAVGGSRDLSGANLLLRWDKALDDGAGLHIQTYYDRVERDQPGAIRETLDTYDLEIHHSRTMFQRHRLLLGGGYRYMYDDLDNLTPAFAFIPASQDLTRGNLFVQDEIALTPKVALTLGLKAEHNNYTKWEWLPSARVGWQIVPDRLLWAAASRAVRTPSRIDREFFIPATPPFGIAGGSEFESEIATVYEVGYRAQPRSSLSYSINVFHNDYDRLRTVEPQAGGATLQNRMTGTADGVDAWASYRFSDAWKLTAGGTILHQVLELEPGSNSIGGVASAGNDPDYSWRIVSSHNLTSRLEVDVQVRHVAELPNGPVPEYTAVDARVGWKASPGLELSLTGQNLFDPEHAEFGIPAGRSEIERAVFAKVMWKM